MCVVVEFENDFVDVCEMNFMVLYGKVMML